MAKLIAINILFWFSIIFLSIQNRRPVTRFHRVGKPPSSLTLSATSLVLLAYPIGTGIPHGLRTLFAESGLNMTITRVSKPTSLTEAFLAGFRSIHQ